MVIVFIVLLFVSILSTYSGNSHIDLNSAVLNTTYPSKIGYLFGWENKEYLINQDKLMEALPNGLLLDGPVTYMDNKPFQFPDTNLIDIKPHFNDDNWIINKAIENYENDKGVYSDIYNSVFRFSYELPTIR